MSSDRIRTLDRLIARLERDGASLGLAQASLERAELLYEREFVDEALDQIHRLETLLAGLEGNEARDLLVKTLVVRSEIDRQHQEGLPGALADLERAIELLGDRGGEPRLLEVDVFVQWGRLLGMAGAEGAVDALAEALRCAQLLDDPAAQVRARRELAGALSEDNPEAALVELSRAEEQAKARDVGGLEPALLLSTHAEVLVEAGRFDEALALLAVPPNEDAPDWMLAQRAATLDMAGRGDEAYRLGGQLLERRTARHDPGRVSSLRAVAEACLAQAHRAQSPEERLGLLGTLRRTLDEATVPLSADCQRLLARSLEMAGASLADPEQAHQAFAERVTILESLVRDRNTDEDRVELIRARLQLGDTLLELERFHAAERSYTWAVREQESLPPEEPLVLALLPLALNALAHALAASNQWLAAKRRLDEAARRAAMRTDPAILGRFVEVFLFRAMVYVNVGDPAGAVSCLRQDVARLLGGLLRDPSEDNAGLIDAAVNMYVLQAEILADHLDEVEAAVDAYDQALRLRELAGSGPEAVAAILGSKGAVLNEAGRTEEALPVLERCLELFLQIHEGPESAGDVALARVNVAASLSGVGRPREALDQIGEASALLEQVDEDVEEAERSRQSAIRTHLFMQRGEALVEVGHPLLASDEFSRSIDIFEELLDTDAEGEAQYEARLRLPLALLRRARCWASSGVPDYNADALRDLKRAQRLYAGLLREESRPEHRRRLREVRELQRKLNGKAKN